MSSLLANKFSRVVAPSPSLLLVLRNLTLQTRTRNLHVTARTSNNHFDTQQFIKKLEEEGLTRKQSIGVMEALEEVVSESIKSMTSNLVTRAEQDKSLYTQKVDFAKLKSEIQLVEKQDFAQLKAENERLLLDVERLKQRLREEISRTSAGVRLDLSLEKGRTRDEFTNRDLKIREVDSRIEGEIQSLRASVAQNKFTTLQYVVTTAVGAVGLLFAYMRMYHTALCRYMSSPSNQSVQ